MTFKLAAVAIVALGAAALSSPAFAANDACTLLTPAEVGVALGTAAGAGEPITPTVRSAPGRRPTATPGSP